MGFDNECILNIQSLAGEYFCPVCRLLVYPNEALQSQCTHLYCKPCLTYIVSTTRACPYDGYLVTEADSKPLAESNKALADTIGKIKVHCLYHRSGCTWQGPLSECTSHCSGCAFGNSPVVCNRCGIQIVHRQVQEHAQNCPGVQPQAQPVDGSQDIAATSAAATGDQTQAATHAGAAASQAQTSQTPTAPVPIQDPNHQASSSSQAQAVVQVAVPTPEQWYQQQQQQYQQYYQHYPGYDPYQQHYQQYHPYQQQAVPQYQQQPQACLQVQLHTQPHLQAQAQPQPQPQPQSQALPLGQPQAHPNVQAPVATQPQSQAQVNPQQQTHPVVHPHSQIQSQTQPPTHGAPHAQPHLYPQAQPHPIQPHSQHVQMPPYQQPHSQMQHPQPQVQPSQFPPHPHPHHPVPQSQPQSMIQPQMQVQHNPHPHSQVQPLQPSQPQIVHPAAHAVTGHPSYPQQQSHQQMPLGAPQQNPLHMHPQQHLPLQMQNQFPQQLPQVHPTQSHLNQQQPALLPQPGQVPNVPPTQQQPLHPHAHQPSLPNQQRPATQPVQQLMPQQYVSQQPPISGLSSGLVQNQIHQQGTYMQQLPVQSQLRPPGPPHLLQQQSHAYPVPQQNAALSHFKPPHQSQNLAGRPMIPNHGVQSQSLPQSASGLQVRSMLLGPNQLSQNNMLKAGNQVQQSSEKQLRKTEQEVESSLQKTTKKDTNDLEATTGVRFDAGEGKAIKSETDLKLVDDENKHMDDVEEKTSPVDASAKEVPGSMQKSGAENGEPEIKQIVKEEIIEGADEQKYISNFDHKHGELSASQDKEMQDGYLVKTTLTQDSEHVEEQSGRLPKDKNLPQGPVVNEFRGFTPYGEAQTGGFGQPSHSVSVADQGRHQPPLVPYGPSTPLKRPVPPSVLHAPPPGPPHQTQVPGQHPTQFRPPGPGQMPHPGQPLNPPEHLQPHVFKQSYGPEIPPPGVPGPGSSTSFGRVPSHYGPPHHSFELQAVASQGPYPRVGPGEHVGGAALGTIPPSVFDSHGGIMARALPYGPEAQMGQQRLSNQMESEIPNQRPGYMDGRQPDPHLSGSLEQGPVGQPSVLRSDMMRMNGPPGPELAFGVRDGRFKPSQDEHLNPFLMDPARRVIDRGEFEEDLKQFPRPSHLDVEPDPKFGSRPLDRGPHGFGMDLASRGHDKGPHGFNYDTGLKLDPMAGSAPSRFLPSRHIGGALHPSDVGERAAGFHEDTDGRSDSARTHPDFLGPVRGHGRRHMDGLTTRSPVREYSGKSSRGFGGLPGALGKGHLGLDDIDGRESHRFGDPVGHAFDESRFPIFPGHMRRGEFDGPGSLRMGEQLRGGDLIGQDSFPGHLRRGEHFVSRNFPSHLRMGEPVGFGAFPGHARMGELSGAGTFPHPRLGEPGFRSSYSLQGFPNDGGVYAGDLESFDNPRKRKPTSMGWCRICKFDCETVEGLELHSQTREHQKVAMDMVISIKQKAKKQKLTSSDHSSLDDASKSRNASSEGRGNKH